MTQKDEAESSQFQSLFGLQSEFKAGFTLQQPSRPPLHTSEAELVLFHECLDIGEKMTGFSWEIADESFLEEQGQ